MERLRLIGRTSDGDKSETIVIDRTSSCDVERVEFNSDKSLVAVGGPVVDEDPTEERDMDGDIATQDELGGGPKTTWCR